MATKKEAKVNSLPEKVKEWAKDNYLGNEVGSDEYREVQPVGGLNAALAYFMNTNVNMTAGLQPHHVEMLKELRDWISAIIIDVEAEGDGYLERTKKTGYALASNMYPGNDKAEPVLARAFDANWDVGVHPYGFTAAQVMEDYNFHLEIDKMAEERDKKK